MGESQKGLDTFEKALEVAREIDDTRGKAYILTNLGRLYDELGDKAAAAARLEEAVLLMDRAGDTRGLSASLVSAGAVYFAQNNFAKAISSYERALKATSEPFVRMPALLNLARVRDAMGERQAALEMNLQVLQLAKDSEDLRTEAAAHRNLAEIYVSSGQTQLAVEHLNSALHLFRKARFELAEANTRLAIARAKSAQGQLTAALEDSEAALQLIDSIRTRVASSHLRSSYFGSKQDFFRFHIDLLMRMHAANPAMEYDLAALNTSERARGRGLLVLRQESGIDTAKGADPALLREKKSIQHDLNYFASLLMRLPAGKQAGAQITEIQKQIDGLVARMDAVEAKLRVANAEYASLVQPQPLTVREIQRFLLPDTALVEYAFGERLAYAWVIKADSVKSFALGPESELTAAADTFLKWSSGFPAQAQAAPVRKASSLLLQPLAAELRNSRRLLIVPEPAFQHVPFGALSLQNGAMLALSHEVVYLPSASVMPALQRNASVRKGGTSQIVVLADPVFHRDDARLSRVQPGELTEADRVIERSVQQILLTNAGARLPRLRFSREEAGAIAELAPKQVKPLLDFEANRTAAMGPLARDARILHFATHTLINSSRPELSGIVLSLVDRRGRPQDGFLRLHEIYNLEMRADLVVLSSCESGLGKEVKGEGLIGFTRAFYYAGASRVLVTLWKVGDEPSAEFMRHFYQALLVRGLRPPAALRAAQLTMAKDARWHSPYYWAGFVLHGDWR
jgi:CHAT domain-containing protein